MSSPGSGARPPSGLEAVWQPDGGRDLLALAGISLRFGGVVALNQVSLTVTGAAVTGLIGPNGSGKTTLFNVVRGFARPQQGTLRCRGRVFTPKPEQLTRLGIACTLQGIGLFDTLRTS